MRHYRYWHRTGKVGEPPDIDGFVNPLVCDCPAPDADPAKDWGQCARCKRKPLVLMVAS